MDRLCRRIRYPTAHSLRPRRPAGRDHPPDPLARHLLHRGLGRLRDPRPGAALRLRRLSTHPATGPERRWHDRCSWSADKATAVTDMTALLPIHPAVYKGAPADVCSAVRLASAETGVSFSYIIAKAAVESGYRTDVKAPTSRTNGLHQV